MKLELKWPAGQQTLEAERQGAEAHITIDGREYKLTLVERQGALLTFAYTGADGRRRLLRVAQSASGQSRHAWIDGHHYRYERVQTGRSAGQAHTPANALSPTIPSVVSQILVAPDQQVNAGDKLILLESMKMVIPIQAPHDGTITAIHCAVGDAVEPGTPLLKLEPASG
jgi:biotin carboxyl carrier protein